MERIPLRQIEVAGAKKRFKSHSVPISLWKDPNTRVEVKLDGHRFKLHITPGENRLDSRRISKVTNLYAEKTDNVPHIRDIPLWVPTANLISLAGSIFDGELCAGKNSGDVSHALGSRASEEEKDAIRYIVFDLICDRGEDVMSLPEHIRRQRLEFLFKTSVLVNQDRIVLIDQPMQTPNEKEAVLHAELAAGREGVMVKNRLAEYGQGWTKVKKAAGYDVVVMGFDSPKRWSTKKGDKTETETKFWNANLIGAVIFGQYHNGELVEMGRCSGMDDTLRAQLSEGQDTRSGGPDGAQGVHTDDWPFFGRPFEIEAQERTPPESSRYELGAFRHPRFIRWRYDKNAKQCVYRKDEL